MVEIQLHAELFRFEKRGLLRLHEEVKAIIDRFQLETLPYKDLRQF